MTDPFGVIVVVCLYMGFLFLVALWAERSSSREKSPVNNPLIYALSLGVYCTSWTYYGSVGSAATSGMLFTTVYLGPTLAAVCWWTVLRKLVRLKETHRITSIADFVASRYGKSQVLAAVATVIALVGAIPYVALQLKAVIFSFEILTGSSNGAGGWIGHHVGLIVVISMVLFTIIFGVRRLDPTERHQGVVMAMAVMSLIKLVLFIMAGVFAVYIMNNGLTDLFARIDQSGLLSRTRPDTSFLTWSTWLILSMSAVLFLPRQFHIAVVENLNENHIRTAMWLFPLYLLLITLFAYPIAMAGLLAGKPASQADYFVLGLPMAQGRPLLALLVFLGGFSAAASMIIISAMTTAVMTSNHLLLPLVGWVKKLTFLERHLLGCRWAVVTAFLLLGYWFERSVGESYMLVNIGMISFAAVLQFAPPILGGIFWRKANRMGAILGLAAGFAVWVYTSLLPSFVKSGWLSATLLERGPLGIGWLNPEHLFGVGLLDPLSHTAFWSMAANIGFFILGSLLFEQDREEASQAEEFVGVLGGGRLIGRDVRREASIDLDAKKQKVGELLRRFFDPNKADDLTAQAVRAAGVEGRDRISIAELAELYGQVERLLSGSIGSGAAHHALRGADLFTPRETQDLSDLYGEILADLRATPEDLRRRVDYYRERETLISAHAAELEDKLVKLQAAIERRKEAEALMRESEERYRTAIENSSDGVAIIEGENLFFVNRKFAEIFGYPHHEALIGRPLDIVVHPDERERVRGYSAHRQKGEPAPSRYDFTGLKRDGSIIYISVSATKISYQGKIMGLAFLRDVTKRRQAEDEIRHLSRRLIAGIEDERKRLAVDLHDEFGQALTGLHMGLESLSGSLPPEENNQRERCGQLIGIAESLADNVRKISSDLRPDMLDDLGLVPTVQWYLREFRTRITGIDVDFQAVGFKRRLPPLIEIVLYRIFQEGLNNVAKHSQASLVTIRLTYSHPNVIFIMKDNGRGFKPPDPRFGRTKQGIGLIGMRERAASAGGEIDIRSAPGKGTQIRVTAPVTDETGGEPMEN